MTSLQDAADRLANRIPLEPGDRQVLVAAARRVAAGVPVYQTSRMTREYAVTNDSSEADAWLIELEASDDQA